MTTAYATDLDQLAAEAMTPAVEPPRRRTYFGEVTTVDLWACVLETGKGKVVFDAGVHAADRRRIAANLSIACAKADGGEYTVDQDVITTSKEWREFTLPSLQRLKLDLTRLKGLLVQAEKVPTGETYTKKNGETAHKAALVFVEVYSDHEAMKAAADALYSKPMAPIDPQAMAAAIASVNKPPVAAQAAAPAVNRKEAVDMIDLLWKMAAGDKPKFVALLQAQPLLKEFHKLDQPEVIAHLGANYDPELGDNLPF